MKSLELNDIAYELGVRVYCNSCKTWYDPREEKGKVRKKKCNHPPSKQRFKSTIDEPLLNGKRKRRAKTFNTRNLKEVVMKALAYKQNVKALAVVKAKESKPEKPMLLILCIAMFLDFKNDVGVEEHKKRRLSTGVKTEFKNHITKWKEATELAGENFQKLKVDNISKKNVASTIKYLGNWSNSKQKKAFGFYNEMYRFLNKNGYSLVAPFDGIEVQDSKESDARAVTNKEFMDIRTAMQNGTVDDRLRGKQRYFDWLPEALDFRALTGRRREEFMEAKFSDIKLIDGKLLGGYIKMIDIKLTRQKNHVISATPRYTKAPIFPEMVDFLMEMGYEKYKGTDRYIVAGDEKKKRITLANNLTNAFSYYRDKIGMDAEVRLNGLRDHFITRMRNEFGDNASFFTGHAPGRTDKKHYYDDKELFEKVKGFRLWK